MTNTKTNDILTFIQRTHPWVEAQMQQLSPVERIAQLIHVAAYSNRDESHTAYILDLVENYHIGGLTFFQGHPVRQAELTNFYQSKAKIPLMISIDGEWGLGMRLNETISFPYQMTLGAIDNDELIYKMGVEIGRQCKRIGIHVNFAPVVDVNNNSANPVIGFRSFGENVEKVISKASAYMRGMQDGGILACAKHFPGHGDTDIDSHFALPTISHSKERLRNIELRPFRELFEAGVGSAMVSHLHIPVFDEVEGRAATLSPAIVKGLLQNEMGYQGLIFTDALDMKGVSQADSPAEVGMKALLAGHDVLLNIQDVPGTIGAIQQAMNIGQISQKEIDNHCRKNLAMKLWMKLDEYEPVKIPNIVEDLHPLSAGTLCKQIYQDSITILNHAIHPINPTQKIATVAIHAQKTSEDLPEDLQQHALQKDQNSLAVSHLTSLQKALNVNEYKHIQHYSINDQTTASTFKKILTQLNQFEVIIISLHGIAVKARNRFGISDKMITQVNSLLQFPTTISCVFASAYVVNLFKWPSQAGIILAYQENDESQGAVVEVLLGQNDGNGSLPVSVEISR